jgi:hypothetical protein
MGFAITARGGRCSLATSLGFVVESAGPSEARGGGESTRRPLLPHHRSLPTDEYDEVVVHERSGLHVGEAHVSKRGLACCASAGDVGNYGIRPAEEIGSDPGGIYSGSDAIASGSLTSDLPSPAG